MDRNKLTLLFIALGVFVVLLVIVFLFRNGTPTKTNEQISEENSKIELAKKIEFVVIRVLPSGFSPKEVTIKKGMIVRFTNPLKERVAIEWEGDVQYTDGDVYEGNDLASEVFNMEGEYAFTDSSTKNNGKVVVK